MGWKSASVPERRTTTREKLSIRQATIADLDVMLEVGLAALPQDPQWHYRFPYRHAHPEDTRYFTELKYRDFLLNPQIWTVMLAEIPDWESASGWKVIAIAVWETLNIALRRYPHRLQGSRKLRRNYPSSNRAPRRDAHPDRMQAWNDIMKAQKSNLFDNVYGPGHFHLQILATHPDYQRQGAGTALCNWGIKLARQHHMAISVFASPMGRFLYSHLQFQQVALVKVQVGSELDSVSLTAMVYVPGEIIVGIQKKVA